MKAPVQIIRAACIGCAAIICAATSYPQPADSSGKQFFDAIKKGDVAQVKQLLKQDPALAKASNEKRTTAILFAVYANHKDIAELLITSGVQPNIFEAVATGRVERVRELLKQQRELVRAYSPDGWTALHLNFGNLDLVKLLLDNGADINAVSKNKLAATPLQGSVVMKNLDLGKLLLERGANVSPRGEEGTTPLHESAGSGQLEFVKLLIERGADVNARDDAGKTPLTIALESKQPEITKVLGDHGAVQ
jgi:ankyrin repeat protein